MKRRIAILLLLLFSTPAWSLDIDEAKERGLVGEAMTGYLAAVETPVSAEVQALIDSINARRKAEFERTAAKTSTTLIQVSHRFYELAVERTEPGHFYQAADGRWVRK